ncbi:hypothetical protein [Vibrio comitans]|uniref:Uncharacterized protein n=1 Tax=Vibrio comitans NBRC 102076 TaxID=1219078 RepID=A0A4Y3IU65_9VIBR|nr:hypothetical protein [Vibrio comitans]GEA62280.1 hypothetical protein VCO01S_34730 [Vibrio comitans NBRC 102076]
MELESDYAWKYGGDVELVLLNVSLDGRGRIDIDYSSVISCRLEEMKSDKAIPRVEVFFESLFRYAESANDTDPTWGFIDNKGVNLAGSALKKSVLSLLPKEIASLYQAAEHFTVRDFGNG